MYTFCYIINTKEIITTTENTWKYLLYTRSCFVFVLSITVYICAMDFKTLCGNTMKNGKFSPFHLFVKFCEFLLYFLWCVSNLHSIVCVCVYVCNKRIDYGEKDSYNRQTAAAAAFMHDYQKTTSVVRQDLSK